MLESEASAQGRQSGSQALRAARRASGQGCPAASAGGSPGGSTAEPGGAEGGGGPGRSAGQRSPRDATPHSGYHPGCPGGCATAPGGPTAPSAQRRALVAGKGQGQPPAPVTFRGRGRDAPRGRHFPVGCAGLGMSSLPCARNKEVGEEGAPSRRHPVAAGAPVSAARAAPPDLYEQGRAGTARGGGAGVDTLGQAGRPSEGELAPGPSRLVLRAGPAARALGDACAPARRPTSSIPR